MPLSRRNTQPAADELRGRHRAAATREAQSV